MIRSISIAFLLTATAMGSGYMLGRDLGRADLAGECADVGIFTLYDEGSEQHKTFHCFEIGGGEPASRQEPAPAPKAEGFSA